MGPRRGPCCEGFDRLYNKHLFWACLQPDLIHENNIEQDLGGPRTCPRLQSDLRQKIASVVVLLGVIRRPHDVILLEAVGKRSLPTPTSGASKKGQNLPSKAEVRTCSPLPSWAPTAGAAGVYNKL